MRTRFRASPAVRSCGTAGGGRGRIRTSVARKERQIYSLLVLATHPPVRAGESQDKKATVHQRSSDTITRCFAMQEPASRNEKGIHPLIEKVLAELAEGFEPPTL